MSARGDLRMDRSSAFRYREESWSKINDFKSKMMKDDRPYQWYIYIYHWLMTTNWTRFFDTSSNRGVWISLRSLLEPLMTRFSSWSNFQDSRTRRASSLATAFCKGFGNVLIKIVFKSLLSLKISRLFFGKKIELWKFFVENLGRSVAYLTVLQSATSSLIPPRTSPHWICF